MQAHVGGAGRKAGRAERLVLEDVGDPAHRAVRGDAQQADDNRIPLRTVELGRQRNVVRVADPGASGGAIGEALRIGEVAWGLLADSPSAAINAAAAPSEELHTSPAPPVGRAASAKVPVWPAIVAVENRRR